MSIVRQDALRSWISGRTAFMLSSDLQPPWFAICLNAVSSGVCVRPFRAAESSGFESGLRHLTDSRL